MALVYVFICCVISIVSTRKNTLTNRVILAGIGVSYIGYALAAAYLVIANRVADFGGVLQGYSEGFIEVYREPLLLTTELKTGYYLAYLVGAIYILSAVLRPLITGRIHRSVNI
jgi:ABC-type Fe3+-siderophore transport system permease subunit